MQSVDKNDKSCSLRSEGRQIHPVINAIEEFCTNSQPRAMEKFPAISVILKDGGKDGGEEKADCRAVQHPSAAPVPPRPIPPNYIAFFTPSPIDPLCPYPIAFSRPLLHHLLLTLPRTIDLIHPCAHNIYPLLLSLPLLPSSLIPYPTISSLHTLPSSAPSHGSLFPPTPLHKPHLLLLLMPPSPFSIRTSHIAHFHPYPKH